MTGIVETETATIDQTHGVGMMGTEEATIATTDEMTGIGTHARHFDLTHPPKMRT